MRRPTKNRLSAALATGLIGLAMTPPSGASSAVPYRWKNCTHVHYKYRHGVAMSYNRGLDRDRDGIACEQH